jgi:predicted ArsR family transcriptional regulator
MKLIDHDVLNFLRTWDTLEFGVTRDTIAEQLGIARTTVFDILMRLFLVDLVSKTSLPITKKRGRPSTFWRALI